MLKVDIKNAFDSLEPETMMAAMLAKGLSRGQCLAVLDLHYGRSATFCVPNASSESTLLEKGVALYVDDLLIHAQSAGILERLYGALTAALRQGD